MSRVAALGAWVLAGLVVDLGSNDPLARAVVLAGAWVLLVRRRVAGRHLKPLAVGLVVLTVLAVLTNGLLSHTGATVLVVLPGWLPLVGGPVTLESFAYGGDVALGLVAAVSVAALLSLLIEATDLVDALPWFLARTGAAVGSALNLVPAVATSFGAVREAQRLRGWRPQGGRALVDLVVPVLLDSIERSVQLAESMEARAFGSGARTRLPTHPGAPGNTVVVVGALVVVACFAAGQLAGLESTWYPYPTVSTPSVTPAVLGPPALLAVLGAFVPPSPA